MLTNECGTYRRVIHVNGPKFFGERQNVETENGRHNPLGYRTGHMIFPATVRWIPYEK